MNDTTEIVFSNRVRMEANYNITGTLDFLDCPDHASAIADTPGPLRASAPPRAIVGEIPSRPLPPAIGPDEDAAALPPRPRWSDLVQLYLCRMVDAEKATRGMEAVADSANRFQEALENPFCDAIDDDALRGFLRYLKSRTWRGKPLSASTIAKHFANLAKVFAYGGPQERKGIKSTRTACRLGLYGCDADGRPRPAPMLFADDLPPIHRTEKPAPTVRDVARWIDACAATTWGPGRQPCTAHAKGFWLACLLIFARNTALRLESIVKAEWGWLDGHWLSLPRGAVKGKKRALKVYVNSWALAAARAVQTKHERLFSWTAHENYLDNLIQEIFPDDQAFRLHRLRAMFATELTAAGHQIVAQCQLGHRGGVTKEHYTLFERIAPAVLEDAKLLIQPRPKLVKLPARVLIRPQDDVDDDPQGRLF